MSQLIKSLHSTKIKVSCDYKEGEEIVEELAEDSRDLSDQMRRLSMQNWVCLTKCKASNSNAECLEEELKITLSKINDFMDSLENFARAIGKYKPSKKSSLKKRKTSSIVDKVFRDRIDLGMLVMDKISELLSLENLDNKLNDDSDHSIDIRCSGSIVEYEPDLNKVVARFARILEARGITHNLAVSPQARMSLETKNRECEPGKYVKSDFTECPEPPPLPPPSPPLEKKENKDTINPIEFLKRVASRCYLSLWFRDLPVVEKKNYSVYESSCELEELSVTAKGKDRIASRKNSASKMVKVLWNLQEKKYNDKAALKRPGLTLTENEKEVALKIICNKEDFPLQLARICDIHTTHGPVYHTLSEDPMYVVQCYALGFKATGSHHRLAIARRVAAKKLLDSIPFDVSLESKHKQKTCIKEKKLNKKLASKRKN